VKILRIQSRKWTRRFDRREQRERLLLFFGVTGLLLMIAMYGIHQPLMSMIADVKKETLIKKGMGIQLKLQMEQLESERVVDPDAPKRKRLAKLKHELQLAESEIKTLSRNIIAPEQMTQFFNELLSQNSSVRILGLESQPPAPLSEERELASPLFKREATLRLQGEYRDLVRYLRSLEALPWKVFWHKAELVAKDGMQPILTLKIYTLSLGKT